tara:strand:- start:1565 stop:1762 length:198 start_codon:yes stop_codon:yes gene_type:complete
MIMGGTGDGLIYITETGHGDLLSNSFQPEYRKAPAHIPHYCAAKTDNARDSGILGLKPVNLTHVD